MPKKSRGDKMIYYFNVLGVRKQKTFYGTNEEIEKQADIFANQFIEDIIVNHKYDKHFAF